MTMTTFRPATQRQFDFVKKLIAERELSYQMQVFVANMRAKATTGTLSSAEASNLIDVLLNQPKKAEPEASSAEPEAGVYETPTKEWFRVYLGQQSGKMLVKRIVAEHDLMGEMEVSYEYLGMATKHLPADARRMTLEEVGQLGIATNHCMICGRRLDDPESVDRGIGPVCASKY